MISCHRLFRTVAEAAGYLSPITRWRKTPTGGLRDRVFVVWMNTDFINIPEKDLKGPETESDQFSEEVRRAVEQSSNQPRDEERAEYRNKEY